MAQTDIEITVNGESRSVADGLTVAGLLGALDLAGQRVAVEHNRRVVPRAEHDHVRLSAGDRIEIVAFVGGG